MAYMIDIYQSAPTSEGVAAHRALLTEATPDKASMCSAITRLRMAHQPSLIIVTCSDGTLLIDEALDEYCRPPRA